MIAWGAENTSVTFTRMRSSLRALVAFSPSLVIGHFTTIFGCSFAKCRPSSTIPAASRLTVSALTGPFTREQIFSNWSSNVLPSFEIRVGFVVMPSRMPVLATSRISSMFAVSRKNFMYCSPYGIGHCNNLLRPAKWRAHGALVAGFVDRGNAVVQAGPVRKVGNPVVYNEAVANRFESHVWTFASIDTVAGQIGF